MVVETACAEMAAARRTEADLAAIRAALEAMRTRAGDFAGAAAADVAFHHAIAAAAHNPCFTGLTDTVGQHLLQARQTAWENAARFRGGHGAADAEHAALVEAIAAANPAAARLRHAGTCWRRHGAWAWNRAEASRARRAGAMTNGKEQKPVTGHWLLAHR